MVEADESGKLTGYTPGTEIKLVRNPNWDAATDYKPAYVDSITIKEGNDPDVASRQILEGQSQVSGDFQLPAPILKSVSQGDQKDLMELSPPTGRFRYIAFRTDRPPFDNADVRRALNAAIDKEALRQAFGGPITGDIPTHYIPPGQPGFDEAGGEEGTGADFMAQPSGNLELAKEYMKKAGYESGMYDGPQLTGVSDNATQQKNVTQVAVEQIKQLGFDVKMRYVVRDSMYTKFCQVPCNQPDVCPSVGWLKDFADPETLLNPVFNGKNILEEAQLELRPARRPCHQQADGRGRGRQRSRRAQPGVGRGRQGDHRGGGRGAVAVGHAGDAPLGERQRRGQPQPGHLGLRFHVPEVARHEDRRAGTSARTTVPPPGGLSTARRPPSAATRSASPARPVPDAGSAPPIPSSCTSMTTWPSTCSTVTSAALAEAYLATLVSASMTTK